jgi:hypothetical protein
LRQVSIAMKIPEFDRLEEEYDALRASGKNDREIGF